MKRFWIYPVFVLVLLLSVLTAYRFGFWDGMGVYDPLDFQALGDLHIRTMDSIMEASDAYERLLAYQQAASACHPDIRAFVFSAQSILNPDFHTMDDFKSIIRAQIKEVREERRTQHFSPWPWPPNWYHQRVFKASLPKGVRVPSLENNE